MFFFLGGTLYSDVGSFLFVCFVVVIYMTTCMIFVVSINETTHQPSLLSFLTTSIIKDRELIFCILLFSIRWRRWHPPHTTTLSNLSVKFIYTMLLFSSLFLVAFKWINFSLLRHHPTHPPPPYLQRAIDLEDRGLFVRALDQTK